jgi:hypothetical protein
MDQEELCRRFILDDKLVTVKKQVSPFTGKKIPKGTSEYDNTLVDCKDIIYKQTVKKTKKTDIANVTEAILPLVASAMSQKERRKLTSAVSVVGVGPRTKMNLEIERDDELLNIPNSKFLKYVYSKYPKRIDFKSIPEDFILPDESYDIFLKYFKKGVPIPKEIEDYFDNPSDPNFYKKLLRIAIQEKIKISEYLLNMLSYEINYKYIIEYYRKVMNKPIPENYLKKISSVKYPKEILKFQPIKSNSIFFELLSITKLDPQIVEYLIEKYEDVQKLIILYYFIVNKQSLQKEKNKLELILSGVNTNDIEKIIHMLNRKDVPFDKKYEDMIYFYLKLLLQQGPSEETEDILRSLITSFENSMLRRDIFKIWKSLFPQVVKQMKEENTYGDYLADIYGNGDFSNFESLQFILEEIGEDKMLLKDFLFSLNQYYNLNTNDIIDVIGKNIDLIPKTAKGEIYSDAK